MLFSLKIVHMCKTVIKLMRVALLPYSWYYFLVAYHYYYYYYYYYCGSYLCTIS